MRSRILMVSGVAVVAVAAGGVATVDAFAASAPSSARQAGSPSRAAVQATTAQCPAGSTAVGGSATVDGAPEGSFHITAVWPHGRKLTVRARADKAIEKPWSVTATAVCVETGELPGLTAVQASLTTTGNAACAGEQRLVGLGWRITDRLSRIDAARPAQLRPVVPPTSPPYGQGPDAVTASVYTPGDTPGNADVVALCADVTNTFFLTDGNPIRAGRGAVTVFCEEGTARAAGFARRNGSTPRQNLALASVTVAPADGSASVTLTTDETAGSAEADVLCAR